MTAPATDPSQLVSRVLSERLQARTASDEVRFLARPQSTDWDQVVGHASDQYVLPALAAALRDLDLMRSLDQELGQFLEAVHAANLERNRELRDELSLAVAVLNRVDIQPVLLKGGIRLVDGLYPDDGWRMLRDLDLLVPEASLAKATRALEEAGYAPCDSGRELRRSQGACQIDLHTELFHTPRQVRLLQAVEILDRARPVAFGHGRVWIPSVEHQLVHLIGHSQIRHLGHAFGRIYLRNLLEAAALVRWGRSSVDGQAVCARFVAAGYRRPLLSLLLALNEGGWCPVRVMDRIDPLTTLQHRRIGLQARSRTLGYIGSRVGWWISMFTSQIEESDGGARKGINNLKRLISERGAIGRMARAFMSRRDHLTYLWPGLGWFPLQ
jgi:Uncharacterised nucleotidyltransferase